MTRWTLLVLAVLFGCITDKPFTPFDPLGTYTLQTVAGVSLPYTDPQSNITVTAGTLEIKPYSRYAASTTSHAAGGPPTAATSVGNYGMLSGSYIGFTEDGLIDPGPHHTGTLSADGNSIEVTGFGLAVQVYRR